jgi:hypothetical protein
MKTGIAMSPSTLLPGAVGTVRRESHDQHRIVDAADSEPSGAADRRPVRARLDRQQASVLAHECELIGDSAPR